MKKALTLFDTRATMHEIELYLWLLNHRLDILAEGLYTRLKGGNNDNR